MLAGPAVALLLLAAFAPVPAAPAAAVPPAPARQHAPAKAKPKPKTRSRIRHAPARATTSISAARARQIQEALVQAGYLDHASGHWDAATRAAMERYQKVHHWQTHFVPDARALIALGLGPALDGVPPVADAANTPAAPAGGAPPAAGETSDPAPAR